MRLIMIRHGRPEWQVPRWISLSRFVDISGGYTTARLAKEGISAIETLAKTLPQTLILSSDLARARETAEIIAGKTGKIEFDPVFRELQSPLISSRLFGKVPLPPRVWTLLRWFSWLFGIGETDETPRAAWNRVAKATDKILRHFETVENIILVSHGWFMILLALHLRWRGLIERGPLIPKTGFGAATEYFIKKMRSAF